MRTIPVALASSILCLTAAAAPAAAAPCLPGLSVVECCVIRCYQDFSWPFNHTCAGGCVVMDLVIGNHNDERGVAPAFADAIAVEGPDGHSLVLAPTAAGRAQVLVEAGSFAMDTDTFEQDTRVVEVQFSFVSSDEYLRDFEDGPPWHSIGRATWSSSSRTWQLLWNASQLPAGEYLLRAEFKEGAQSRHAVLPVHVP
jgi:hypothetical protein